MSEELKFKPGDKVSWEFRSGQDWGTGVVESFNTKEGSPYQYHVNLLTGTHGTYPILCLMEERELELTPQPDIRVMPPLYQDSIPLQHFHDSGYVTKDSGQREAYSSGMVRDTQEGKPRYDLVDLTFLKRWAELMGRGAEKYGARNWELASSEEELERFKASAFRHLVQWLSGDQDEDHAVAVAFNLAAAEYVKKKLEGEA